MKNKDKRITIKEFYDFMEKITNDKFLSFCRSKNQVNKKNE